MEKFIIRREVALYEKVLLRKRETRKINGLIHQKVSQLQRGPEKAC